MLEEVVRFLSASVVVVLAVGLAPVGHASEPNGEDRKTERSAGKPADDQGEKVKVYTNEDLPSLSPADVRATPARDDSAESGKTVEPLTYDSYRDRDGRDAEYWRSRVAALAAAVRRAERERDRAFREMRSGRGLIPDSDEYRRYLEAAKKVEKLKAERSTLREEARTAGALPEWVRGVPSDDRSREGTPRGGTERILAPVLLSPGPGEIFDRYPRHTLVTWGRVDFAATYEVEVQCLRCCGRGKWCPQDGAADLHTTQFAFTFVGAQPGRWRVRAVTGDGVRGAWSVWREFRYLR